jgi:hypothetical protein
MKRKEPRSATPPKPTGGPASTEPKASDQPEPTTKTNTRTGMSDQGGMRIPPVLLEGDFSAPTATGPGAKYASSPEPEVEQKQPAPRQLPEAYGTGQLLLTARDPHSLYAHWDLTAEHQLRYSELSSDRYLLLKVHEENQGGPLVAELRVHSDCNHCFVQTETRSGAYMAELGYYPPAGPWTAIAASGTVVIPREEQKEEQPVQFATLSFPIVLPAKAKLAAPETIFPQTPFERFIIPHTAMASADAGVPFNVSSPSLEFPLIRHSLASSVTSPEPTETELCTPQFELEPEEAFENVAEPKAAPAGEKEWTPAQDQAMAQLIALGWSRHHWLGSQEIEELIRGKVRGANVSAIPKESAAHGQRGHGPISSEGLSEAPPAERAGFWLNINAELVIYGATDPTAKVTLGGRSIQLRADGTFSCRFALPDGSYQLPVTAVSTQGEVRQAELDFYRGTVYRGEVSAHPQDPELSPPAAQNLG